MTFDEEGRIQKWSGNPILLNATYAEDARVLRKVRRMAIPVQTKRDNGVGFTKVLKSVVEKFAFSVNFLESSVNFL